jgi:hypothetical protein
VAATIVAVGGGIVRDRARLGMHGPPIGWTSIVLAVP